MTEERREEARQILFGKGWGKEMKLENFVLVDLSDGYVIVPVEGDNEGDLIIEDNGLYSDCIELLMEMGAKVRQLRRPENPLPLPRKPEPR